MSFDERLAARVRRLLADRPGFTEKKMFGCLGFLLRGHVCCGIYREELIVRLPPGAMAAALAEPHVRAFDITGRPMQGWVLVAPAALAQARQLNRWVSAAVDCVSALPAK